MTPPPVLVPRTFPRRLINRIDFGTHNNVVPSEYMSNTNSQVVAAQGAGNPQSGNTSIATTVTVVRPIRINRPNIVTGAQESYVAIWRIHTKDLVPGMVYNNATREREISDVRYFEMVPAVATAQLAEHIPELAFAGKVDADMLTVILNQAMIEVIPTHHNAGDEYTDAFGNTQVFKNEGYDYKITKVLLCDMSKALVSKFADAASNAIISRITKQFGEE